jgi:hypothetical protein
MPDVPFLLYFNLPTQLTNKFQIRQIKLTSKIQTHTYLPQISASPPIHPSSEHIRHQRIPRQIRVESALQHRSRNSTSLPKLSFSHFFNVFLTPQVCVQISWTSLFPVCIGFFFQFLIYMPFLVQIYDAVLICMNG